jgi:CDP-glucose 4,6-dehydratase
MEGLGMNDAPGDRGFWRGRRVLVTGHSGFKGGWLAIWLARAGADVTGIALPPESEPNLFDAAGIAGLLTTSRFLDIRDAAALKSAVAAAQPEIVFHLAAQPLVRRSYAQPAETFATNVVGTVNLLDAVKDCAATRAAVLVTTDKVYANREWPWPYRENDALGGHDPYSASKAACEIAIASYREAVLAGRGIRVASARAGNVIGGGDWSEDRLLPDAIRAWQRGATLGVRRPDSVRPWQHVTEPLAAYMTLARRLWDGGACDGAYNFGPSPGAAASVRDVVERARAAWGGEAGVTWGDGGTGPHEAGTLTLEIAKARVELGVVPRLSLDVAIARSVAWYRRHLDGADALALCHADIDAFEAEP